MIFLYPTRQVNPDYIHPPVSYTHVSFHSTPDLDIDNYPEPGKQPVSSTSPAVIENPDGSFYASIGGSGGRRIFPSVAQALLNLDWGLDASEAVEFGRLHDQLYPLRLEADDIYPPDALEYLRQVGHNVTGETWLGNATIQYSTHDNIFR
jgi:gamma-glutamyltranspeptidase